MISKDHITEWRQQAPWVGDAQVEQDLILSRAIVEIFGEPSLAQVLAFRGATAIYKLHVRPALRYSEDIDLVQVRPGPIGATIDALRGRLDSWLGEPRRQLKEGWVNLVYRFDSEDDPPLPLRLKIEINSREHFAHLGLVVIPFEVTNRWFSGSAGVVTYSIDELFGTKLRALYQRKKGRDLFDLWAALTRGLLDPERVLACFLRYMEHGGTAVTRAEFEANLFAKGRDASFTSDVRPVLATGTDFAPAEAFDLVHRELVARLPGEPWKGV